MENSTHFYRFFQDIYISIIFFNVFIFCFELGDSLLQNSLLTNSKRIPFAFCIDALSILTSIVHRRLVKYLHYIFPAFWSVNYF